jgi:hypothetical protein
MQLQGTGREVEESGLNDEKKHSGEQTKATKSADSKTREKACLNEKL